MKSTQTSSVRTERGERNARDLRRAFRKELRRLLRRASRDPGSGDVHAVRKGITKLRSWLRVARAQTGWRQYQTHNRRLRRAARALAPIRDARVILATFEGIGPAASFPNTSLHVRKHVRRAERVVATVMRKVRRRLAKGLDASHRLRLDKITNPDLATALERMREEMNAAFVAARAARSMELLHTWRKRTKNYLHALAFVAGEKNRRHRSAVRINRLLGTDHDLALLETELAARRAQPESRALLTLIAARRAKLHRQFFPTAARDWAG